MFKLRSFIALSAFVVLAVSLTACTAVEQVKTNYDVQSNVTTYKMKGVPLSNFGNVSGIHEADISMFAEARCRGQDCRPDKVRMRFRFGKQAGQTGNRITFQTERLWIQADKERLVWEDPFRHLLDMTVVARGEIGSVECTYEEMKMIAEADDIEGRFGGIRFDIRRSNRAPLRAFIDQFESQADSSAATQDPPPNAKK